MKRYWVYILASRSQNIYTGMTNNLMRRVQEHKGGKGSEFTGRYKITRLVHYEVTSDVRAAIAREKQIKGWDRTKKIALIEATNPLWEDLAPEWTPTKVDSSLRSE